MPSASDGSPAGHQPGFPDPWPAPFVDGPVSGSLALPGSKSLTNRYLVLAALADAPSRLRSPLHSRDTELMATALASLGAKITATPGTSPFGPDWMVEPIDLDGGAPAEGDELVVDCGLAGTVMRFVPPVAALLPRSVRLDGDTAARVRPMRSTIEALRSLGVVVDDEDRGTLPFTLRGTGDVRGGYVEIDASASSQFVTGLLLTGSRFGLGIDVRNVGASQPSQAHIDMTLEVLRDAGIIVDDSVPGRWQVEPGVPRSLDVSVEPDLSNAAPFLAAAVACGGSVRILDWPTWTTQPGDAMRSIVEAFGASAELDRQGLTVTGGDRIRPVHLDLHDVGELTPVVAALAALADGPSTITGVGHLRGHETDRLAALSTELNRLGGRVRETETGLSIEPAELHGGVFRTYHDHRMAMAGAVIGLRVPGVGIENVATTSKTLPEFPALWQRLTAGADAAPRLLT